MKKLIVLFAFTFSFLQAYSQWSIELESGLAFQSYNDVRIPNETGNERGTEFSFTEDFEIQGPVIPLRLNLSYTFAERNHLSALYAPLEVNYEGIVPVGGIKFQDSEFAEGEAIDGFYKFNSYRLTYRRDLLLRDNWTLALGFTAKIRDARIELETDMKSDRKDDLGFVPLLNIHAAYEYKDIKAYIKGDALAGGPGRAFDFFAGINTPLTDNLQLKGGYRIIEGGADVSEVYNFTLLNFASIGLILTY